MSDHPSLSPTIMDLSDLDGEHLGLCRQSASNARLVVRTKQEASKDERELARGAEASQSWPRRSGEIDP